MDKRTGMGNSCLFKEKNEIKTRHQYTNFTPITLIIRDIGVLVTIRVELLWISKKQLFLWPVWAQGFCL